MNKENETTNNSKPMAYNTLLAVVFGKLLCRLGWHKWSYILQDAIDEFGYLPMDGRMPKTATCDKCGANNR